MTSTLIGSSPVWCLPPLEYRYALDAAMARLGNARAPIVICNAPSLLGEVRQRGLSGDRWSPAADAALWVEPLVDTWPTDLATLDDALIAGAPLTIVASLPLARVLPERRSWHEHPLGLQPGGIDRLRRGLVRCGFALDAMYGIHSMIAVGLSLLSRLAARSGRPDLGDRLHFAARLRYCVAGPLAALSTVALLVARKEPAS